MYTVRCQCCLKMCILRCRREIRAAPTFCSSAPKGHSKEKRTQPLIYCAISIIPREFHTYTHAHTRTVVGVQAAFVHHAARIQHIHTHTISAHLRPNAVFCYGGRNRSAIVSFILLFSAHSIFCLAICSIRLRLSLAQMCGGVYGW